MKSGNRCKPLKQGPSGPFFLLVMIQGVPLTATTFEAIFKAIVEAIFAVAGSGLLLGDSPKFREARGFSRDGQRWSFRIAEIGALIRARVRVLRASRRDRSMRWRAAPDPGRAAEVALKNRFGGASGQRLCSQRRIRSADAVRKHRVVGNEESLHPARLRARIEYGIVSAQAFGGAGVEREVLTGLPGGGMPTPVSSIALL